MKNRKFNKEKWMLFMALFIFFVGSLSLIYIRQFYRISPMIQVVSQQGNFDLTDIDFNENLAYLEGDVLYIPGILSPEEFASHDDQVIEGSPWHIPSATSRIRIYVPDNKTYTITASSVDFAHRVYVNGKLRFEAGNPADNQEEFKPGYAQMTLDVQPQNGYIEIIQQGANFVHREGGGHSNLYFGESGMIQTTLAQTFGPEYVIVGLFATLFLVHLVLFIVHRTYKANLIFACLCFTWMIRSGITGAKVFYALFPSLPWQVIFRMEYLTLPIAAILIVLLLRELFPQIPQVWFIRIMMTGSVLFLMMCLFIDTVSLSYTLFYFELLFTLAIFYLCIRFMLIVPKMMKAHQLEIEHVISLFGFGIFMIATINDALYHAGVLHALKIPIIFALTAPAMLIFSFFQMTTMFYGTMREITIAHEHEQKMEAEKEMLSEMNRLKSAFYADLSHEMKTPLTVIAINAQFVLQNIQLGAIDEETIGDLNAISGEAKRLAQMVTSLVGIGRIQGTKGEYTTLQIDSIVTETVRIYQTLFARKQNVLTSYLEPNLPAIEGNGDQLIQVLINLLSNANRHTSEGIVHVEVKTLQNFIHISVIDNGTGISQELLPHVFERYYHGQEGNSGLGLSICKTIVEEHGGEIGVKSVEGKGTTVWLTIPIKEARE